MPRSGRPSWQSAECRVPAPDGAALGAWPIDRGRWPRWSGPSLGFGRSRRRRGSASRRRRCHLRSRRCRRPCDPPYQCDRDAPPLADLAYGGVVLGRHVASIRSWTRRSSLPRLPCRSPERGIASRSIRMPVPALSADSELAHVIPAAPRSWMPSTRRRSIHLQACLNQELLGETDRLPAQSGACWGRRQRRWPRRGTAGLLPMAIAAGLRLFIPRGHPVAG